MSNGNTFFNRREEKERKELEQFHNIVPQLAKYFPDYSYSPNQRNTFYSFRDKNDPRKGFDMFKVGSQILLETNYRLNNRRTLEQDIIHNGQELSQLSCRFSHYRDAESIARDMKRRFFPKFDEYYFIVLEFWDKEDKYVKKKNNIMEHIVSLIGIDLNKKKYTVARDRDIIINGFSSRYSNVQRVVDDIIINPSNLITIKLHPSLDKSDTLKILDAIVNIK